MSSSTYGVSSTTGSRWKRGSASTRAMPARPIVPLPMFSCRSRWLPTAPENGGGDRSEVNSGDRTFKAQAPLYVTSRIVRTLSAGYLGCPWLPVELIPCISDELNLFSDPISRTSRISRRVRAYYPGKSRIVEFSLNTQFFKTGTGYRG